MLDFSITSITEKIFASILAILVVYLLSRILSRLFAKWIHKADVLYSARKRLAYVSTIVGVVFVVGIWTEFLTGLTTFLGIIGAGIALALKDPLTSVAGWLYLTISRVYSLGDRIEIDGLKGDVVDIGVFQTTLLEVNGWVEGEQSTGRLATIPHNWLFFKKLYNYTTGFKYIWTEISVAVTFESDWKEAQRLITGIIDGISGDTPEQAAAAIRTASNKYLIKMGTLTPIVYTSIVDFGVQLTARFLVPVRSRRAKESQVYKAILDAIDAAENIDLAYTTYRIVQQDKKADGGPVLHR